MVDTYYSVDRRNLYHIEREFKVLPFLSYFTGADEALIQRCTALFPNGLSPHGIQHFAMASAQAFQVSSPSRDAMTELYLELFRKSFYPQKPCRYTSMFACSAIEEAVDFRSAYGSPNDAIYELHPNGSVHRGDMGLLGKATSIAMFQHYLGLYWEGKTVFQPGYVPKWEYVLELPVTVGKRLDV